MPVKKSKVQKMAILRISPQLLQDVLCLPADVELIDIQAPLSDRGVLEIKIVGAGWETPAGCEVLRTTGVITKKDRSIDWGFPSS